MKFIGREKEKSIINGVLRKFGFGSCLLYGRRRMGKTYLLRHCMEKPITCYFFQCRNSSESDNTELLAGLIDEVLGTVNIGFKSFMSAVEFIFRSAIDREMVFIIDEYPYIRSLIAGCDSCLQEIIDKYCDNCNLKFFISGSSISIMEDVMDGSHPLYERFHHVILLKQMDYYDSSLFYRNFSNEDKVMLYSALGGVPYYNALVNPALTAKENIISIISGEYSRIEDYLEIYLKAELRKVNNAYAVFSAIACGAFHYTDILSKSHIGVSSALTTILQKLITMDLIEYTVPINDRNNKQKAGYRISDNSIGFYFNFIYRHYTAHKIQDEETFYDLFIENEFKTSFIPLIFENITKEYLIRQNKKGLFNPVFINIGTYWYDNPLEHTNGQFDVVGQSEQGYVFFECRYKDSPITDEVIKKEIEQVGKTSLKAYQYGFVSKSGFSLKADYPFILITLDDIYK